MVKDENTFYVAGRRVVFRSRLPAGENWDLLTLMRELAEGKGGIPRDQTIRLLSRVVEAWEFEGDPQDPAAYEALDLFEVLGLMGALGQYVARRTQATLGNSLSEPTSP